MTIDVSCSQPKLSLTFEFSIQLIFSTCILYVLHKIPHTSISYSYNYFPSEMKEKLEKKHRHYHQVDIGTYSSKVSIG